MTGGSLPAQTWREIMTYAHNGIDLKPIPDIDNPFEKPPKGATVATATTGDAGSAADAGKPATLSAATTERLFTIEQLLRKASRLKPLAALAPPLPDQAQAAATTAVAASAPVAR
jgi:penicillin-binding protein 1A